METKRCSKCGEVKDLNQFYLRTDRTSGYHSRCKSCLWELCRRWAKLNPLQRKKTHTRWAKKNRENLTNTYIKMKLIRNNILVEAITPKIIELKREQILLFRNLKQLKEVYYESNHSNPKRIESTDAKDFQGKIHSRTNHG